MQFRSLGGIKVTIRKLNFYVLVNRSTIPKLLTSMIKLKLYKLFLTNPANCTR